MRRSGLNFDVARGLDNVAYAMLKILSFRARLGWGGKHAEATQRQRFSAINADAQGDAPEFAPDLPRTIGSAFRTLDHRKLASAQIEALEGQSNYQGAAFREIARGLLAAPDWKTAGFWAQLVANAAGVTLPARSSLFEAIAERVLRQLAEHRFTHWSEDSDLVLNPMATAMGTYLVEQSAPAPHSAGAPDHSLRALYGLWREQRHLAEDKELKSAD